MMQSRDHSIVWQEIEPYCILRRIWKNFWMVLMSAGLFALLAYIGTALFVHPSYTCSATFAVTPRNTSTQSASAVTASATKQFSDFLSGTILTSRVQRLLGEDAADATATSSVVEDTNIILLTVSAPSPRSSYYMCKGILDHYEDYSTIIFSSLSLELLVSPSVPDKGVLQSIQRRAILYAAPLGALAMILLLSFLCIISGTLQTITGARNQVDGTLLVTLNHQHKNKTLRSVLKKQKSSLLISNPTTSFLYVETIHQLRTQVEHAYRQHGCKTFAIASVGENEGKSTVAANLALSLARRHKKVLLVDCDLRKAAQHLIFEAQPDRTQTITALLKEPYSKERLEACIHYRKADNLYLLFASNVSRHSGELLASEQMKTLLNDLRSEFEYIILDSSPMSFFADGEVLCDLADASILTVRQDLLPDRTVNDAIDTLNRCHARFLGFVFNDVRSVNVAASLLGGHRYGYGYGYGRGYGYGYGYGGYKNKYYGYGYGKRPNQKDVNDAADATSEDHNAAQDSVTLATSRKKED